MNFRQRIILLAAAAGLALDFIYVFVQRALATSGALEGDAFHTLLVVVAFGGGGWYYYRATTADDHPPIQLIGRAVIAATALLLMIGVAQLTVEARFTDTAGLLAPTSFSSLVVSAALSAIGGACAMVVFVALSRLVFLKRRKNTRRNYLFLLAAAGLHLLLDLLASPNGFGIAVLDIAATIAYVLALIGIVVNAFHFSWILVLSRREKFINLLLSLFGFVFFLILSIYSGSGEILHSALRAFHPLLHGFVSLSFYFGTVTMGIAFAGTLLHLPTAKEFDRKKMEISTLQNLSRLITQVFDFDELMATTTHLALEVSEGHAAWLELFAINGRGKRGGNPDTTRGIVANSLKNIAQEDIAALRTSDGRPLRQLAVDAAHAVLVQDFANDRRIDATTRKMRGIGCMILAPLISHGEIIGLLCVTRTEAYTFDKDAVNVLSAFADMVSVAIENSTLIRESIVKERMEQELLVAQTMQRSLLPQELPSSPHFEIAAQSIPAYEVGGDYYDVLPLDDAHLGFVVGDVSGKGVSAALYMAQVKGIFQSLGGSRSDSTRDVLVRMNAPLCNSMERKSFISLLYAVLHTRTGTLAFSRAGHCPLLHVRNGEARFLQPEGMALGLDGSTRFAESLREEYIRLEAEDIVVLYTDGVTEARDASDQEFATTRLAATVTAASGHGARDILDAILRDVRAHSARSEAEDDITVLVLRWRGGI
ncbi:MAG: SpoIIE family protein phosphatase [Bacteroidota bacterium]|jgi:serine phosphatase RsbU (regulator of sigma subunit)|nr:SpoIIE family protein phosphatase [Bacteroidota bacterium]